MAVFDNSDPLSARRRKWVKRSGMGALRVTLLFGTGMIALTLILVPILDRETKDRAVASVGGGIDLMTTGSIPANRESYTIRRSVLQPSPDSECIIRASGQRYGEC